MRLNFNNEIIVDLGETATYADRRAQWVPVDPGDDLGRIATLTISLTKNSGKAQEDSYFVWELPELPNLAGRVYQLEKYVGEGPRDPFEVVVGAIGSCGCPAGQHARKSEGSLGCKHRDALAAILQAIRERDTPILEVAMPFEPPH